MMHGPASLVKRIRGGPAVVIGAIVLGVAFRLFQINPALAQTTEIVAWEAAPGQPLGPSAAIWRSLPAVELPLTAQQAVLPMGGGSIPTLEVKALHSDGRIYLHLAWADDTADESTTAVESFADAVAVQLPGVGATSVPAICMGQIDQGVNIWHWRADSQRGVPDSPASEYADVLPGNGDLDYPARYVGNWLADPTGGSAQNLVAAGFGTLEPAPGAGVAAAGEHASTGWTAVFERELAAPGPDQPDLVMPSTTDVVFAVWNGSEGDRDGQKSVSAFATLRITDEDAPSPAGTYLGVGAAIAALLVVVGAGSYLAGAPSRATSSRWAGPSRR